VVFKLDKIKTTGHIYPCGKYLTIYFLHEPYLPKKG